jgi:signal transduction histidine kinase
MSFDPEGATWIGNKDGSVLRVHAGKVARVANVANEIGVVSFLDATHGVVIGGEDAMAVLVGGKFHRLHADDPDMLAGVSGLIVTAEGDRWLNSRNGVVHIPAAAWARVLAHPDLPLEARIYGEKDGYPGIAQGAALKSTAIQSADGKLWFAGSTGIAWLDPARRVRNAVAPALAIGRIELPGARDGADGARILPPGSSALRIDYTALSFTQPQRVRFRYQLEGQDIGWQAAGSRRTAFYTNLGPGHYRFRVMATNEDGVDSLQEADMQIVIEPTMVQTTWFKVFCALLLVAALLMLHRWRTRQLAARHWERFQERLSERERIARSLRDNLLQNFQGLILFFRLHSEQLAPGDAARVSLDNMLGQASDALIDARQEITGMRQANSLSGDLGEALATYGAELQAQFGPRFSLQATPGMAQLTAFAWNELYAVGREAMFNACQHAGASHVEVQLSCSRGTFVLAVLDDGCGIDVAVGDAGGRTDHWGLPGMRERARCLGGTVSVQRRATGGTEVVLRAPARRVFVKAPRRWGRKSID